MMDKDKLYRLSIFEKEKFKRIVAKLGLDDLTDLKNYFDRAMPTAINNKDVNLKIRLANYNYLISYINHDHLISYMTDDQTMNQIKPEEQKESSMGKLKKKIDSEMKHLATIEYRAAQKVPIELMLTTGEHYDAMIDSSMPWSEMKLIHDRGYLDGNELLDCDEILSTDSDRETLKFRLKYDQILVIRNSQIIGMLVDKKTILANINDFVNKLVETVSKYNLTNNEVDNYFGPENEW